ncbi:EH domain-containing protein 4 [Grus japonensis]|uniref:EH domain-containing protein 4 n=1 Tax=Grus japonensis TaxID=30415 RepID=A0ABC9YG41_GRUJA
MVKQAVPLKPMEDDGEQRFHLQPVEDPTLEAHAGASSWQDLWTRGERTPHQSRVAGRTCDPMGGPVLEQSGSGLTLEKFVEDCLP